MLALTIARRKSTMNAMDTLAEALDHKLHEWEVETSEKVRILVAEIMASADEGTVDILRSRAAEQEVLDILDAPSAR